MAISEIPVATVTPSSSSAVSEAAARLRLWLRLGSARQLRALSPSPREVASPNLRPVAARAPGTFEAADPPKPRVREIAPRPPRGPLRLVRRDVGAVADVCAGVEPVVGTDGDGHEAEGGEGSHRGQQHLDATVTPHHGAS